MKKLLVFILILLGVCFCNNDLDLTVDEYNVKYIVTAVDASVTYVDSTEDIQQLNMSNIWEYNFITYNPCRYLYVSAQNNLSSDEMVVVEILVNDRSLLKTGHGSFIVITASMLVDSINCK